MAQAARKLASTRADRECIVVMAKRAVVLQKTCAGLAGCLGPLPVEGPATHTENDGQTVTLAWTRGAIPSE